MTETELRNQVRELLAEAFHEYRRHLYRFLVPYVKFTDENKQGQVARLMAAAWQCLHYDHERVEPYARADELLAKLEEHYLKGKA